MRYYTSFIKEVIYGKFNDPFAYMLTIIILGLMSNGGYGDIIPMLLSQIILGIVVSIVLSKLSIY